MKRLDTFLSTRGIHYVATRFGWPALRSRAFDSRFAAWKDATDPLLASIINRHAHGADLWLMGCGTAGVLASVNVAGFDYVHGADISETALGQARRRFPRARFYLRPMEECGVYFKADAIVFPESLYYVANSRQVPLLQRLRLRLSVRGVLIVTLAQPHRYAGLVESIRRHFTVIDEQRFPSGRLFLTFR